MRYLIFITLWLLMSCQDKTTFVIDGANTIWIAPDEPAYIRLAVQDLISDVEKITGKQMVIVENPSELKEQSLVIGTINNPSVAAFLPSERLQTMQGKWEQYTLLHLDTHQNLKQLLLIAGSNPRGTMFGIYHFWNISLVLIHFIFGQIASYKNAKKLTSAN
ncbi:MAG: hypothetical protein HC892_16070 [Saprospiraceae bacterium]|nr:hypothetical protein [Saprospiraceae bacterium]